MTDGVVLSEDVLEIDVLEKLYMIYFILTANTTTRGARIPIEADEVPELVMYDEHTIRLQQKGMEPAEVFLEVT